MQDKPGLQETLDLMRDLRERCDWDHKQTHETLRPYLVEEAYELDEALQAGNDANIREELGDVLLQILFHSVIAEERDAFDFGDVAHGLITKMRGRHPHLYGDGVKEPWERMKARKRETIGEGLPAGMPALHRAHRLQDRAAGVGFDWPDTEGPLQKVAEELEEVRQELQRNSADTGGDGAVSEESKLAAVEAELGDLLFSCVNLCRKAGVHASIALDKANRKFQTRFTQVEKLASERGIDINSAALELLDSLWDETKKPPG